MMDLVNFRSNRAPRRATGAAGVSLAVERSTFGTLLTSLRHLLDAPPDGEYYPAAQQQARDWLYPEGDTFERVEPDQLELEHHPNFQDGEELLWLLVNLDIWLTARDNTPAPQEFADKLAALFALIQWEPKPPDGVWLPDSANRVRERLLDTLAAALLLPEEALRAQRITRLLMVYLLLTTWAHRSTEAGANTIQGALFASAEQILSLLRNRFVTLPNPPFPAVMPAHRAKLVREATVADLWVVRSEWRCYVAGELADIRNLMAHERLARRTLRIDETEVTSTVERQRISSTDTSTETTEASEFNNAARREMDLAIHADGQVNTSGQYGPTKVDTHFGGSVDYSLKDASDRATRLARSAIARASSHEETRVRTERVERTLTRFELEQTHGFEPADKAQRGLYRWVDRIDRMQMYRFPDRLQLEFQLPEPGRHLYEQLTAAPRTARIKNPGEFTVTAADVTVDTYADLAIKYEASGVPTPQQPQLSVTVGLSTDKIEMPADDDTEVWHPPTGSKSTELAIPPGYAATRSVVQAHATPVHGIWRREDTASANFMKLEGFHTLTMSVAVGEHCLTVANPGPADGAMNTVQGDGDEDGEVQYLQAVADINDSSALDPPVTGKVPVTLTTVGASTAAAAIELACSLTTEAEQQWRQGVLEALLAGYSAQLRAYRDEQDQLGLGQALYERSPARNAEMIREELKRLAVGWLLDESPFNGRDAVGATSADIDLDKARAVADDIEFFEQALEWTNMAYVPYPYYWARRGQWAQLEKVEAVDPDLARFLRAGSVRLVVPARPGFTDAVQHWLLYRQRWGGGCPPVPGHPLYLSVAEEVRDLTQPPPDGVPGDSWEVRLPTTLQWLDTSDQLPHNPLARLGKDEHAPADPLCPDGAAADPPHLAPEGGVGTDHATDEAADGDLGEAPTPPLDTVPG